MAPFSRISDTNILEEPAAPSLAYTYTFHEDGGGMYVRKVGIHVRDSMVS
jgi:hypothetical protein